MVRLFRDYSFWWMEAVVFLVGKKIIMQLARGNLVCTVMYEDLTFWPEHWNFPSWQGHYSSTTDCEVIKKRMANGVVCTEDSHKWLLKMECNIAVETGSRHSRCPNSFPTDCHRHDSQHPNVEPDEENANEELHLGMSISLSRKVDMGHPVLAVSFIIPRKAITLTPTCAIETRTEETYRWCKTSFPLRHDPMFNLLIYQPT